MWESAFHLWFVVFFYQKLKGFMLRFISTGPIDLQENYETGQL